MQKVIFVMGVTATGKTYFIDTHYSDINVEILNIYDYQQRAYDEAGFRDSIPIPFGTEFRCLMKANNMLFSGYYRKSEAG